MIYVSTLLKVADNTGARFLYCINIPHTCFRSGAFPGTIVKGSVRRIITKHNVKKSRVLKLGQICQALVIRTVYGFKRWGSFYFSSSTNAVVIINKYFLPIGTRLFGPVFREIRGKQFFKVVSKSEVAL